MRVSQMAVAVLATILVGCSGSNSTAPADNAGGATVTGGTSGSLSADTIKVGKHFWVEGNHTLLVSASSSDQNAHLYLSNPAGARLGEVQNGSAGRYGGTVFFSISDPVTLTITSSSGGSITFATVPFQP